MSAYGYKVREADWVKDRERLQEVREIVFVREQGVPPELELDDKDPDAYHFLALSEDDKPIGTGRLLHTGQIGRMAVLQEWRGKGVGRAILLALLARAVDTRIKQIFLNAQIQAIPFYQSHGFIVTGSEFMDAGIPHLRMEFSVNG